MRILIGQGSFFFDAFNCATFKFRKYAFNCASVEATFRCEDVFANPKLMSASAKSMDGYFGSVKNSLIQTYWKKKKLCVNWWNLCILCWFLQKFNLTFGKLLFALAYWHEFNILIQCDWLQPRISISTYINSKNLQISNKR